MLETLATIATTAASTFYAVSRASFIIYVLGTLLPRTIDAAKTWVWYIQDWFTYTTDPLRNVVQDMKEVEQYHWALLPILLKSHTNLTHIDTQYVASIYQSILQEPDPVVASLGKAVLKMAATDVDFSIDFTSYMGWYLHKVQIDQINTNNTYNKNLYGTPNTQFMIQHKQSVYIYNDSSTSKYANQIAIMPSENTAYSQIALKSELMREHTAQIMQALFHNFARPYGYEHEEVYRYHTAIRQMLKKAASLSSVHLSINLDAIDNLKLARLILDQAILSNDNTRYVLDSYANSTTEEQADIEVIAKFVAMHTSHTYSGEVAEIMAPIAYYWEHDIAPRLADYTQDYVTALLTYANDVAHDSGYIAAGLPIVGAPLVLEWM